MNYLMIKQYCCLTGPPPFAFFDFRGILIDPERDDAIKMERTESPTLNSDLVPLKIGQDWS
jgi:hypothetical protein